MIDYRAIMELEEELMEEIKNEKFFSFKRIIKTIELNSLYSLR